ncbi:MAG: hypothetical protein ACHQAY_26095 [Hyphomicrobiales bacterium]
MSERPNTIVGLVDKRREVAGKIEQTQRELRDLVVSLDHLDSVIRLFDPNADLGTPKRYPVTHAAFKGEMARFVLSSLRQAKLPITSLEVAKRVMEGRGLNPDHRTIALIRKRTGACLMKLKAKGIVREVPLEGDYKGWELAR